MTIPVAVLVYKEKILFLNKEFKHNLFLYIPFDQPVNNYYMNNQLL